MDNGSEQTCSKFLIGRKLWREFKFLAITGVYASGIGCLYHPVNQSKNMKSSSK